MDLGFRQREAHAEDAAAAIGIDANRRQNYTIPYAACRANLFVTRIDDQILNGAQRSRAPFRELCVEQP